MKLTGHLYSRDGGLTPEDKHAAQEYTRHRLCCYSVLSIIQNLSFFCNKSVSRRRTDMLVKQTLLTR